METSAKDILDQEINGAPVTVRIRGTERPLRYALFAVVLYKQLTGDSLFLPANFQKIELTTDPDRWMKCLWAGLHELQADRKWKAPFTLEELGALVDFSNAGEISVQMVKALTQSMPKPAKDKSDPKVAPPSSTEDPQSAETSQPSSGSMHELVGDSELIAASS